MVINAYFDNVLVYNVDKMLDVVKGTSFALEMDGGNVDVFSNNDKVLSIDQNKHWVEVQAVELGTSVFRVMDGTAIVKDLIINVMAEIKFPVTDLGVTIGEPVQK